ncbi:MAG: EamA family transporter [Oligoflexales bacterium]|nr:EamA family transporter [Oligoflexales bacterium]
MSSNVYKSILWVLGWSLSFSVMMVLIRKLEDRVSIPMLVYIRLICGFIFFLPYCFSFGVSNLKTSKGSFHLLRVLLYTSSMLLTFYAYAHLPITTATSIGFSGPIITSFLSILMLGERVGKLHWLFIFLGYGGVLTCIGPSSFHMNTAIISSVLANLLASFSLIAMKKLTQTENLPRIMFWANFISILLLSIGAPFFWEAPSREDLFILIFLGIIGVFSQFSYIKALVNGSPALVAPFEFSRLLFAIPIGLFYFSEPFQIWTLLGGLLIIVANTGIALLSQKNIVKNNSIQALEA